MNLKFYQLAQQFGDAVGNKKISRAYAEKSAALRAQLSQQGITINE